MCESILSIPEVLKTTPSSEIIITFGSTLVTSTDFKFNKLYVRLKVCYSAKHLFNVVFMMKNQLAQFKGLEKCTEYHLNGHS